MSKKTESVDVEITAQDIQDACEYLLYACAIFMGGEQTTYSALGGAVQALTVAASGIENEQKQTSISEEESTEGTPVKS